jgi:hypothetical protein
MAKGGGAWQDGRRAWERLTGWSQERGHPDDGDAALTALSDVGQVRRLLDQAELVAVRTARTHGKAWAEIATRLGVTRQSAWERWRDLDETAVRNELTAAADAEAGVAVERAARAVVDRAARRRIRAEVRNLVVVPDVIGLRWDEARDVLSLARLIAISPDPDGPPLSDLGLLGGVVVNQAPKAGAVLPPAGTVTVWIERGGGAGDREPRRPKPTPRVAREVPDDLPDELSGEAAALG